MPEGLRIGLPEHNRAAKALDAVVVDLRVENAAVDTAAARQEDRLAFQQRHQVLPVDARYGADLGLTRLPIAPIVGAVIGGRLRHKCLAGGFLQPFARPAAVLLAHGDRQVGATEQRARLLAEPGDDTRDLLEAEHEGEVEAAALAQHALQTACGIGREFVEAHPERRCAHAGLVAFIVGSFERPAEQLRHHRAQRRDAQLAEGRQRRIGVFQRRQVYDEDTAIEHDVAHVDVAVLGPEDVAKADRKLREDRREVELRVAVLLARLAVLLLVERQRVVIAGQLAKIGPQRRGDLLGNLVLDVQFGGEAGARIADRDHLVHRHVPNPGQLDGRADQVDVEHDTLVVAQPDKDRRDRADQGHRPLAEHTVRVGLIPVA